MDGSLVTVAAPLFAVERVAPTEGAAVADGETLADGDAAIVAAGVGEGVPVAVEVGVGDEVDWLGDWTRGGSFPRVMRNSPAAARATPAMPRPAQPRAWRAGSAKKVRTP